MHKLNIHINENGSYIESTINLWSSIPSTILEVINLKNPQEKKLDNGKCNVAIAALAILIEGFVTDIITDEIKRGNNRLTSKENERLAERATWSDKEEYFKKTFNKELSTYTNYDTVKCIFSLRNNIAHGRTFKEQVTFDSEGKNRKEILHVNYKNAVAYIEKHYPLPYTFVSPTIICTPHIIAFLLVKTSGFLFNIVDTTNIINKDEVRKELDEAFNVQEYPVQYQNI